MLGEFWVTALIGLIGTAIGAILTFVPQLLQVHLQERRESGNVETADASTVFSAYGQLSQMLLELTRQMSGQLNDQLAKLTVMLNGQQQELEWQQSINAVLTELQKSHSEMLAKVDAIYAILHPGGQQ